MKQIIACSLYYNKNSVTATNKIFDEVWSRIYNNSAIRLSIIVPEGQCPRWIDKNFCMEINYNNSSILDRLAAHRKLNQTLSNLPSSIVINDFFPIPFYGLSKHTHIQFVPHIYSIRESLTQHLVFKSQISQMRNSGYILTISETSKREIVDICGFDPRKIIVSYCGISSKLLHSCEKQSKLYTKDYDLLYIATFISRKNHLNLLRALPIMSNSIKLAFLGKDLGYKAKVDSLVKELGLQDHVKFLKPIPETALANLYRSSSIFVSPSLREGFGMPVAEALAIGIPVACSELPVFREIAGSEAFYFNPYEPASIASTLDFILNSHSTHSERMLQAQVHAKQKFSWDSIVKQLITKLEAI